MYLPSVEVPRVFWDEHLSWFGPEMTEFMDGQQQKNTRTRAWVLHGARTQVTGKHTTCIVYTANLTQEQKSTSV